MQEWKTNIHTLASLTAYSFALFGGFMDWQPTNIVLLLVLAGIHDAVAVLISIRDKK